MAEAKKAPYKKPAKSADANAEVLEKIGAWPERHRPVGERLHEVVLEAAPKLKPKLFYGMPGYATSGPVLIFFRVDGDLFTFGITEKSHLTREPGAAHQLMPSSWFFTELDAPTEERIAEIVKDAVP